MWFPHCDHCSWSSPFHPGEGLHETPCPHPSCTTAHDPIEATLLD